MSASLSAQTIPVGPGKPIMPDGKVAAGEWNRYHEEWNWRNNDRRAAAVSRVDSWEERTFVDQRVREFQMSRERFSGRTWYFEFMAPAQAGWATSRYPAAVCSTPDPNWLVLQLE